jgi:hypothetical protein
MCPIDESLPGGRVEIRALPFRHGYQAAGAGRLYGPVGRTEGLSPRDCPERAEEPGD